MTKGKRARAFNAKTFLDSPGLARTVAQFSRGELVFSQGDVCSHVLYIQQGA